MSIKDGITIGSVSRMVKATGLNQAKCTIMKIVHDSRRLVEGKQFPAPTKRYRGSRKRNITDEE